jgi:predicted metal-dependent hydrolase
MEQIVVGNISIDVVRKDIKNIHLAVYPPAGKVRIAAPLTVNEDAIRLFAVGKLAWIKKNQQKFAAQERLAPREYKNRESHYFKGQRYLLRVVEVAAPPRVCRRSRTFIDMQVRPGTPAEKRHRIMNEWYRSELKKSAAGLIEKWQKKLQTGLAGWQVRQMKTRWGSCSIERKSILLNLELAKKPVACLEYIIVHELLHLRERRHNEQFQLLLDRHLPDWKKRRDELNRTPASHATWSC